jgi:hypothetical protein
MSSSVSNVLGRQQGGTALFQSVNPVSDLAPTRWETAMGNYMRAMLIQLARLLSNLHSESDVCEPAVDRLAHAIIKCPAAAHPIGEKGAGR